MTYSVYDFDITKMTNNYIEEVNMIEKFSGLASLDEVAERCKTLSEGTYLIPQMNEFNEPIKISDVYFRNDENGDFLDCAEWDFRVIASVGFGKDLK